MSLVFSQDELLERSPSPRDSLQPNRGAARPCEAAAALAVLAAIFWWTYEADLRDLVKIWDHQPDYSHGYLVPPLALAFLWVRRETFPGFGRPSWIGLILVGLSLVLRIAGQWLFLAPLQGWSMIFWVGGACWLLGGTRFFVWLLPSIAFLFFMVPLPYRSEGLLSYPLQRIATKASTWIFQLAGLPAISQGNTILIDSQRFEVEQACSGLRMLIGVGALAFAYAIVSRSSWGEKVLLLLCVLPVAIAANCLRIVGTGCACVYFPGDASRHFAHDFAGWTVIPLAATMLYLGVAFWRRLVIPLEAPPQADLLRDSELLQEPSDHS